jgi:SAM-dependent methyltransferase
LTAAGNGPLRLRAGPGTYAGLFLITLATLMYEIALTRVFSVTMWYHFAFLAISVALFGMTAGALLVHLRPYRFRDVDLQTTLWRFSLLFSASLALCFVTQLSIPFAPRRDLAGLWSVALTCVVVSIPFVFSGVVVCLALTRFPRQVNRLYAADLVGAALGCVLLVVLFTVLDGPSLVIAVAALAAAGSFAFAAEARSPRGMAWAGAAVLALGGFAVLNSHLLSRGQPLLRILWTKQSYDPIHAYETWNAFSRVTVDGSPDELVVPTSFAPSPTLPADIRVNQLGVLIDSNASTVLTRYDGNPDTTDFLRYDLTNLAHYIRRDGDVLVVGVGGGRDILSALEFGQRTITGVEINANILHVTNERYGDFTGHLDRHPRVRIVNDEARSYLAGSDERYDLIQISLIDTWAASSAGAYALTENALYTTEAWDVFFDRLKPGGILSVSRWYELAGNPKPLEIYRTTALASQALTNRGVARPREHIVVYRSPPNQFGVKAATVLVSAQPFSADDLATLRSETGRLGFTAVLTPGQAIDSSFASLAAPGGPRKAVEQFVEDVSPPTDNRPFFFQMANLETLLHGKAFSSDQATRPVLILGLLALIVLALAGCFIILPLLRTTNRAAHRGMFPFYGYFAGIGLGFLFIEIAQLQRLSIFLGHPTYALTVVLFSLLVFSGIGSMASERLVTPGRRGSRLAAFAFLLTALAAAGIATPELAQRLEGASTSARIASAVAILALPGLLMGMPFAIGMRAASARRGAPTAFMWGINGATSVCASVFGVVFAVFFGISTAYWSGVGAYAVAAVSLLAMTRREVVASERERAEAERHERVAASA